MSLINDALKRASEAQAQAQARPRGPKGVQDLPVPMLPAPSRERRAWVPVMGIGLVVVALLAASGFFFVQWWEKRQSWQPYAAEDLDEDGQPKTNLVAKAEPPKVTRPSAGKPPVTPAPAATNPTPAVKIAVNPPTPPPEPPKTNIPPVAVVPVVPPPQPVAMEPPAPKATNPVVSVALNPPAPPAVPPPVAATATNSNPPAPTPAPVLPKKSESHPTQVASVEFPDLKLQGISRGKKKTFATVNGKTVSLGDRIEGVMLVKIDVDSVTVEKSGARRELFLLR
ncbi:MAG: hypothetical protein HZA92_00710 [Verrucomicrobia bacterium]|nr:hypothetical protein [Verrucomicrobiota bacterium]